MRAGFLDAVASLLRKTTRPANPKRSRILVIRRNRMGDMICTLPLFRLLKQHFPHAHLAVACDAPGEPIARACDAVDEVIVLLSSWNRWIGLIRNARRLQDFDWVLAAKGGFDSRLATLTRLTNGTMRIGFEPRETSAYYTHTVALSAEPHAEHQIETQLRLLQPLGVAQPAFSPEMLELHLPPESRALADRVLAGPPFSGMPFALINISSNRAVKFTIEDYAAVIRHLLDSTSLAIGIVSTPADQDVARTLAKSFPANRVAAIATPGPLDLAAFLERATLLLTPEGGAGHLASSTHTPVVVLWSGPYGKWHPRGARHVPVEAAETESRIPVQRVIAALDSLAAIERTS